MRKKTVTYGESGAAAATHDSRTILEERIRRRIGALVDRMESRQAAADAAGLSTSTLDRYVSGRTEPSFFPLLWLAQAAGVSLDWYTQETEPPGLGVAEPTVYTGQTPGGVDAGKLTAAMEAAEEGMGAGWCSAPRPKRAKLVATAYRLVDSGVPADEIGSLISAAR